MDGTEGIREFDAKRLLARYLPEYLDDFEYSGEVAIIGPATDLERTVSENPWILEKRLVVKPDQLFGKRGVHGLVMLNASWDDVREYLSTRT